MGLGGGFRELTELLSSTITELYSFGEAIAGSFEEARVARRIRGLVEEVVGVRARLVPVPVALWRPRDGVLEVCDREIRVAVMPQTLGGNVEGRLAFFNSIDELERADEGIVGGAIVAVEASRDFEEEQSAYMHAVEKGAEALVFYDPYGEYLRRFVVTGRWDYSFRAAGPAPLPAYYAPRSSRRVFKRCGGARARIEAHATLTAGRGFIVEALVEPRGGGGRTGYWEIMLTAHHDHWLGGANDDLAGVAAVIAAAKLFVEEGERLGPGVLRLVSFTAEEFGDPGLPGWYWAYGSRWYARQMEASGLLRDVVAVLNIDVAGAGQPRLYASGPELQAALGGLADSYGVVLGGYDHPYTDSYSFSRLGVPAATVMDLDSWLPYYHSDSDTPQKLDYSVLARVALFAAKAVEVLARRGWEGLDYEAYGRRLVEELRHPLAQRSALKLYEETRAALRRSDYHALANAYRVVTRRLLLPVFEGDYRVDKGGFSVVLAPQMLVLKDLEAIAGGDCGSAKWKRVVPGVEEVLPSAGLPPSHTKEQCEALKGSLEKAAASAAEEAALRVSRVLEQAYLLLLLPRLGERVDMYELASSLLGEAP